MGISAILGVSKKASYTDITSKANYMDRFYVAEIPTSLAVDDCQILKERLPESPFIIKVTPKAQPENFFSGRRQKVTVEKVYSGNRLNVGDDIYITSNHWKIYPGEKTLDTGFVNPMKQGSLYLVFLSESVISPDDPSIPAFRLQSGNHIDALFYCDSCDNLTYPVSGDTTYLPYTKVKNNEFFAVDQKGVDAFLTLKKDMFKLFP